MMPTGRARRLLRPDAWRVTLAIVFLAALAVRLYGLDWDDGSDLHPDELFIAKIVLIDRIHFSWPPDAGELLDPARSGLNPRSSDPTTGKFREFAYGALPLWITDASAWFLSRLTGSDWNGIDRAYLVGRALSALLSALTIIPITALGLAAGSRTVGLLAALFAALAPMSIQLAHFFTTDSWLTFFVALCLAATVRAGQRGGSWRFAAAGLTCGLAMATKGSVFTLAIPISVAVWLNTAGTEDVATVSTLRKAAGNALAAALAAAVGFFAFEPYAFLEPSVYLQSLRTQADIVSGRFDVPFSRVYVGTTPLLYQAEQFVRWGYGPVAGILALCGLVLLALLAVKRQTAATILLAWGLAYGAVIAISEVKYLRYLEPLAPVFAVAAALALSRLLSAVTARRPRVRMAIGTVVIAGALLWTASFVSIYAHENPRIAATHWIFARVPPGSTLTADYWDDSLPRSSGFAFSPPAFGFAPITLDLYRDLPPEQASTEIFRDLRGADFIVQSSRRLEAAVAAAPWRYAVQERYFDQLEREVLGFNLVARFARFPGIAFFHLPDTNADESFVNYDHPTVSIYQQTRPLTRPMFNAAMSWSWQRPWAPMRNAPPRPSLLLDHPVGENPSVADYAWSAALTGNTPVAICAWVALLLAILAVGIPIARGLLPTFPDRGWGLARTLALVIAAYPVWLGASLQLFRFRALWVVVSLAVTGILAWGIRRRSRRGAQRDYSHRSRLWLHAELAFWLVFALFLAFRLITPDGWHPLWGGEKPMEFAQINAITRSAYFPPYDPWFADGYLNYYYYGLYLVAFLFKAIGIPSEVGFNLALPTMMGLLASGGFSTAAALTRGMTHSARLAVAGGWIGVVTVCLVGNLSAVRGLIEGGGDQADAFLFWTWSGSRAIDNAITEFPYFSGLYADLHAHVIALPLTVAVIGLTIATAQSRWHREASEGSSPRVRLTPSFGRLLVLALLIGSLSATNIWDVPVYAALSVTALFMATSRNGPVTRWIAVILTGSAIILAGAWLLFLPFHTHFVALFGQVAVVRDPTDPGQFLVHFGSFLLLAAIGLCVLLQPGVRSSGVGFYVPLAVLILGGVGLALALQVENPSLDVVGFLVLGAAIAAPPYLAAWQRALHVRDRQRIAWWLSAAALSGGLVVCVAALAMSRSVLAVLLLLAASAAAGWLCLRQLAARFVCLMLVAAFSTGAGVEVLVVADDLIGTPAYRMNTVFKFYNQIWILLALASASLLTVMIGIVVRSLQKHDIVGPDIDRVAWARLGVTIATLALVAAMVYPVLATVPRLEQRFFPGSPLGSLDALAWMSAGTVPVFASSDVEAINYAGDAEAIAWLNDHITDTPVIAEASIGPYRCNGSRISAATGLPTIIGWERHEQQQRYPEELPPRVADVRALYTSSDVAEKLAILRRYNVEYVIVGDLERLYPIANNECSPTGSAAGIAAFDEMVGDSLEVAHAEQGTIIYRVLPDRPD